MSFVAKCFPVEDEQDGPLYKCRLLRSEDPAFGAKPRPKWSAKFFQGRTRYCVLSLFLPPNEDARL